jgi:predicted membrane protein
VLKTKSLFKKPVIHQKNTRNTLLEISSFGFQQKETIDENLGVFSTVFFWNFTLYTGFSHLLHCSNDKKLKWQKRKCKKMSFF